MTRPLEVIEHENADLHGEGVWTGTPASADGRSAPLPVYPAASDLPDLQAELRRLDRQCRRETVLFGAACMAVGAFLSLLVQAVLS